jgi:hypothetical protein
MFEAIYRAAGCRSGNCAKARRVILELRPCTALPLHARVGLPKGVDQGRPRNSNAGADGGTVIGVTEPLRSPLRSTAYRLISRENRAKTPSSASFGLLHLSLCLWVIIELVEEGRPRGVLDVDFSDLELVQRHVA